MVLNSCSNQKEAVMNSLEQAYIELQPKLYTFFVIKTSNIAVAEDLTQDVFYEASKTIYQFKGNATISTWLFSIARHLLAKYYHSKKYERSLHEQLGNSISPVMTTETSYEVKEELRMLQQHIAKLDELTKEIVLLRMYGELSFADIGELIGITHINDDSLNEQLDIQINDQTRLELLTLLKDYPILDAQYSSPSPSTLGYTLETYSIYEKATFKPNILIYLTKENRSKEEAKEIVQNIQKTFNEAGVHYLEFQVQQEKMENNDLLYAFDVTKTMITSLK